MPLKNNSRSFPKVAADLDYFDCGEDNYSLEDKVEDKQMPSDFLKLVQCSCA